MSTNEIAGSIGAKTFWMLERFEAGLEAGLEWLLFNCRWILSIFYFVLVLALGCLAWKFVSEFFFHFIVGFISKSNNQLTLSMLDLVETTLLANLLLIVIFNGYENFVSKITISYGHEDRPKWMGDVDFAGLKLKLLGTMVAISAINLLQVFLQMSDSDVHPDPTRLSWMIAIHVAFVVTGVLFALTEKIGSGNTAGKWKNGRERSVLLVHDGHQDDEAMHKAQVSSNELKAAILEAGCKDLTEVDYALLHIDGHIQVRANALSVAVGS